MYIRQPRICNLGYTKIIFNRELEYFWTWESVLLRQYNPSNTSFLSQIESGQNNPKLRIYQSTQVWNISPTCSSKIQSYSANFDLAFTILEIEGNRYTPPKHRMNSDCIMSVMISWLRMTFFRTDLFNVTVKFILILLNMTIEELFIALLTSEEAAVIQALDRFTVDGFKEIGNKKY